MAKYYCGTCLEEMWNCRCEAPEDPLPGTNLPEPDNNLPAPEPKPPEEGAHD